MQELHQDRNEGSAIADYNGDGKTDVSAGKFWYEGPDFTTQRPLRKLESFGGGEYLTNNGEHALDLNLDARPDLAVTGKSGAYIIWDEAPAVSE